MVKQAPLKLRDQQICVSVLLPNKAYFTPPPTQPLDSPTLPSKAPVFTGLQHCPNQQLKPTYRGADSAVLLQNCHAIKLVNKFKSLYSFNRY